MDSRKLGALTEATGEVLTRRSALGWLAAAAMAVGLTTAGSAEARNNRRGGRNGRGGRGHGGRKNGRKNHRNGRN
jgi:hypothetical protein